jgi:hypothetical protein
LNCILYCLRFCVIYCLHKLMKIILVSTLACGLVYGGHYREHSEDGINFWILEGATKNKFDLPDNFHALKKQDLDFVCETIEQMVELVLASMKVRYKEEMSLILHQDYFRARWIDNEFVIVRKD